MKKYNKLAIAGLCLVLAGFIIFMGIITAEAYYPVAYSTATNEISDLGAAGNAIYQPSALIFNLSMIAAGFLVLCSVYLLFKRNIRKILVIPLTLFGIGILGVGLFPSNTSLHAYFAILTFVAGGVSAITSSQVTRGLFRYTAVVLGLIALLALIFNGYFAQYLGAGGIERWIAYPTTIWMILYGGYLLNVSPDKY